jgi:hypothetical protein
MSLDAQDLIKLLLNKKREERILPEEIPIHPFFKGCPDTCTELKNILIKSVFHFDSDIKLHK